MMNNKDDYFESIGVRLLHGDCLDLMGGIQDKSIDMILCDLPYGVLNRSNPSAKWDCVIDFDRLWEQYKRITKPNAAIDRKSTRLNSSHQIISYDVFCFKKKTQGPHTRSWDCTIILACVSRHRGDSL